MLLKTGPEKQDKYLNKLLPAEETQKIIYKVLALKNRISTLTNYFLLKRRRK